MKRLVLRLCCIAGMGTVAGWSALSHAQTLIKVDNSTPANSDTYCSNGRLAPGSSNKADSVHAYCPWLMKDDDGQYKMWYSANDGANVRICYATSSNGLDWLKYDNTKITNRFDSGVPCPAGCVPPGSVGKGDEVHAHAPSVIKDNGIYKMWYMGAGGSPTLWRFYYATSPDGMVWTKYDNTLATTNTNGRLPLGTGSAGDTNALYWMSVMKDGATYKMWYGGQGGNPNNYRIYHATSPDGLTWTKYNNTVEASNNVTGTQGRLPLGTSGGDTLHLTAPRVIKQGLTYLMWYQGSDAASTARIFQATSTDGLTWIKKNNQIPVPSTTDTGAGSTDGRITTGSNGRGDDWVLSGACPVDEGRTLRFAYYGAKGPAATYTARVYCATWTKDYPTIQNTMASNVTVTTATLVGNLVATGQAPATVRVYWGTNDAGLNWAGWGHTNELAGYPAEGAVTADLGGLTSNTLYYYRWFATNQYGFYMADPVRTFITADLTAQATDPLASEVGTDSGVFTLSRPAGLTNSDLTVHYTLSGTATNGVDYRTLGGTVVIPAGATNATVTVTPTDDGVFEGLETVILTVSGGGIANASATVTIARNDADTWTHRAPLRFAGYTASGTLTNFPVLVALGTNITGFSYGDFLSGANADLRFADSNLTCELNYEIEKWDPSGPSYVWVQLPTLASSNDRIWVLWGKEGLAGPAYSTNGGTWDTNYLGVWHMGQTNAQDSTRYAYHGSASNNTDAVGFIGGGQDFNGSNAFVHIPVAATSPMNIAGSNIMESAWIRATGDVTNGTIATRLGHFYFQRQGTNQALTAYLYGTGPSPGYHLSTGAAPLNEWVHAAYTYDGGTFRFYLNGYESGNLVKTGNVSVSNPVYTNSAFRIGWDTTANARYWKGQLDEVRVSLAPRSANWIWAEWMNQASNGAFVAAGAAEVGSLPIVVSSPVTNIAGTTAILDGDLTSVGAGTTAVRLYWGMSDGGILPANWQTNILIGSDVPVGPLTARVSGLTPGLCYVFRYSASNNSGVAWSPPQIFLQGSVGEHTLDAVALEDGRDPGVFTISRPASATNLALTVNYTLTGTASNGVDYETLGEVATIPAGASNVTIVVTPIPDAVADDGEAVTLTLAPGNYNIGAESTDAVTVYDAGCSSWLKSSSITFSGYGRGEALTNFPALVVLGTNLPGFSYADLAYGDGRDLRFTDVTRSNELNYEIEAWNTNGASYVWVQVPRLVGFDTTIWACWGRSYVGAPPCTTNRSTWDSTFRGVWHMAQTNTFDASAYTNNGMSFGNTSVAGQIGLAQNFAGSNHVQISHSDSLAFGNPSNFFSLSAWVKTTVGGNWMAKGRTGTVANIEYDALHGGTNVSFFRWCDAAAPNYGNYVNGYTTWPLTNGQWHHVAVVHEGLAMHRAYADGVLLVSDTTLWINNTTNNQPLELGRYANSIFSTNYYTGALDEMRLEGAGRSSNWMWACWVNVMSNAAFGVFSAPGAAMVSNMPPTAITAGSASMNGYLSLAGGAAPTVMVFWGPNDGGNSPAAWSNVTVFPGTQSVGPLATNVTVPTGMMYHYRYCASNSAGTAWAPEVASFVAGDVTVEASDPNASEQALDPATFTVRRPAGATNGGVTVSYTVSGTASAGTDYVPLSGSVSIPTGADSATVTVSPLVDNLIEGEEDVVLTLASGFYVVGSQDQATVTLGDMSQGLWTHRMPVTFKGYTKPGVLSNFPALVTFSTNTPGFSYADVAFTNATDLMFANSNETQYLDYEVERWDTAGTSYVWVRLPALASSNDTIWAYWGNPSASALQPCQTNGSVWNADYVAVWHMGETNAHDSTRNRANCTSMGNTNVPSGVVGGAQGFTNNTTFMSSPGCSVTNSNLITVETWVKHSAIGAGVQRYLTVGPEAAVIRHGGNGQLQFYFFDAGGGFRETKASSMLLAGPWYYVAGTYDGANERLFWNGSNVNSLAIVTNMKARVGATISVNNGEALNGFLDEMRVSSVARSSNWVWACYMNMASNEVFNSNGLVRVGPVVANTGATAVSATGATLNGYLSSTGASPTSVLVYWGPADGGFYRTTWANTNEVPGTPGTGAVSVTVGPLTPDVTYYYRFYAVNAEGESWASPVATVLTAPVTVRATDAAAMAPGGDTGQFTVCRPTSATGLPLVVNYTASGTAVSGTDYAALSGSVTIPAGATNATITVTPFPATDVFQPPTAKTVTLTLAGDTCVVGAPASATVTIDQSGSVQGWSRQMLLTFSGYNRSETLTNFPVLVKLHAGLSGFRYRDFLSGTNADLRFVSGDCARELSYEIDTWNTNGTSLIWVQVPTVSGRDSSFWVCWGKAGVTAPAYTANASTWSNGFSGVWHLNESGSARVDASPYRTGSSAAGSIVKTNGMIGQADWYYYPNGDDYVAVSNSAAMENVQEGSYTVEAWTRPMSIPPGSGGTNDGYCIVVKQGNHMGLMFAPPSTFRFTTYTNNGNVSAYAAVANATGDYHYVVGTLDRGAGSVRIYVDGQLASATSFVPNTPAWEYAQNLWRFGIGWTGGVQYKWPADAWVDEPRISSVARSSNWVWACWMNVASNSLLLDYGEVEPRGSMFLFR